MPIEKTTNLKNHITVIPQDNNVMKEYDEPSKLEQCLRYGSAAVESTIVTNPNISLPFPGQQNGVTIINQGSLQSSHFSVTENVPKEDDYYGTQCIAGNNRESIDSLRRDSTDSGKSDIITSCTIDTRLLPKGDMHIRAHVETLM